MESSGHLKHSLSKGFKTIVRFFIYSLVLRCKQVDEKETSFLSKKSLGKEVAMVARLEEYVTGDLISENLENKIEALRKQLEQTFCYESLSASVQEDFNRVRESIKRLQSIRKIEEQLKQIKQTETLTHEFSQKYKPHLTSNFYNLLLNFCKDLKDSHSLVSAINSLATGISSKALNFQGLSKNLETISDFIDEYPSAISHEFNGLHFLATLTLDFAKKNKAKSITEKKYQKQVKYTAGYILHRCEEVKLQNKENSDKISLDELFERWENEYDEDEMYETSILLEQAFQSDSSS